MRNLTFNRLAVSFVRSAELSFNKRAEGLSKLLFACLAMFGMLAVASQSEAMMVPTVIYEQNFNAGLPVSEMTQVAGGTVTSSAGAAMLSGSSPLAYLTNDTFTSEPFTIDVDVNQLNGAAGGTVSGIAVGNRVFFIFPGFTGGAFNEHVFNVNTATIGTLLSSPQDINMGFTPAQNVFHHFKIDVDPINGNFDVRIYENGNLLSSPFLYQVVGDAGFVPGQIGFYIFSQFHDSLYDNLTVTALRELVIPAPEPSSIMLLGLGLVAFSLRRKTRRA